MTHAALQDQKTHVEKLHMLRALTTYMNNGNHKEQTEAALDAAIAALSAMEGEAQQQLRDAVEAKIYNVPASLALASLLSPGYRLIYRDAFRWKDDKGSVLPNHYDGFSAAGLAADFGYEVAADLGFAAVIRDQTTAPPPQQAEDFKLQCEVAIAPGTMFGIGTSLSSVIASIKLRNEPDPIFPGPYRFSAAFKDRRLNPTPSPGPQGGGDASGRLIAAAIKAMESGGSVSPWDVFAWAEAAHPGRWEATPPQPEAQVSDAMVERAIAFFWSEFPENERDEEWWQWARQIMRETLTAALTTSGRDRDV